MTAKTPQNAGEKTPAVKRVLHLRREAVARPVPAAPADTLPRISGAAATFAPGGTLAVPAFARPGPGGLREPSAGETALRKGSDGTWGTDRQQDASPRPWDATQTFSDALRRQRRRIPNATGFWEELT